MLHGKGSTALQPSMASAMSHYCHAAERLQCVKESVCFVCCRGRKENLEKARALWNSGNTGAAYECYQKAVDISPTTAKQFIEVSSPNIVPHTHPLGRSACLPPCLRMH